MKPLSHLLCRHDYTYRLLFHKNRLPHDNDQGHKGAQKGVPKCRSSYRTAGPKPHAAVFTPRGTAPATPASANTERSCSTRRARASSTPGSSPRRRHPKRSCPPPPEPRNPRSALVQSVATAPATHGFEVALLSAPGAGAKADLRLCRTKRSERQPDHAGREQAAKKARPEDLSHGSRAPSKP